MLVREMSVRCVDDNFDSSSCKDNDVSGDDDGDGMYDSNPGGHVISDLI